MADPKDVADAVVAELNATAFDVPFTAARVNLPELTRADLAGPAVVVAVMSERQRLIGRHTVGLTIEVGVGVVQRPADLAAEVDELLNLARQIARHFLARQRLPTLVQACVTGTRRNPYFDDERLRGGLFMAVVVLMVEISEPLETRAEREE